MQASEKVYAAFSLKPETPAATARLPGAENAIYELLPRC